MPATKRILIVNDFDESLVQELQSSHELQVDYYPKFLGEITADMIKDKEYDLILLRSSTISDEALALVKPGTIFIRGGTKTSHLDNVKKAGFEIQNTPGMNSKSAAEKMLADIWYLLRSTSNQNDLLDRLIQARRLDEAIQNPQAHKSNYLGHEMINAEALESLRNSQPLAGKKVAIIGSTGHVGRHLYEMLEAAGADIVGWSPSTDNNVGDVTTDADIICVCTTPGARDLITVDHLEQLAARHGMLVNITSADVVTSTGRQRLQELVTTEQLKLAVDYYDPNLAVYPGVVSTNHIGAETVEAQQRIAAQVASQVRRFVEGQVPVNVIQLNPYRIHTAEKQVKPSRRERLNPFITLYHPANTYSTATDVLMTCEILGLSELDVVAFKPQRLVWQEIIALLLVTVHVDDLASLAEFVKDIYTRFVEDQAIFEAWAGIYDEGELTKETKFKDIITEHNLDLYQLSNTQKHAIECYALKLIYQERIEPLVQAHVEAAIEQAINAGAIHPVRQAPHSDRKVYYTFGPSGVGKTSTTAFLQNQYPSDESIILFFDPIRIMLLPNGSIDETTLNEFIGIDFEKLTHDEVIAVIRRQVRVLEKMLSGDVGPETVFVDRTFYTAATMSLLLTGGACAQVFMPYADTDLAMGRVMQRSAVKSYKGTDHTGGPSKFNDSRTVLDWHKNISRDFLDMLTNMIEHQSGGVETFILFRNEGSQGVNINDPLLVANNHGVISIYDLLSLINFFQKAFLDTAALSAAMLFPDEAAAKQAAHGLIRKMVAMFPIRFIDASSNKTKAVIINSTLVSFNQPEIDHMRLASRCYNSFKPIGPGFFAQLYRLDLGGLALDDTSLLMLTDSLPDLSNVIALKVGSHQLTDACVEGLVSFLINNPQIKEVDISGNDFTATQIDLLRDIILPREGVFVHDDIPRADIAYTLPHI